MGFERPDTAQRLRAIGPLGGLAPELQRAFTPGSDFDPVPEPASGDWLAVKRERGQTFEKWARTASSQPAGGAERIYLRPVGDFQPAHSRMLERLRQFGERFFARELHVLPALAVEDNGIAMRRNRFTDVLQLNTRDILAVLARDMPSDARCVLGVTDYDLYPHDTWSFVFGEALLDERVGVFGLARYDPRFYGETAADPALVLRRGCKVLAHEACHMLGLRHCVYFNCLMNGSNSLAESDRRPLHLCPVDLRKLQWSLGVDLIDRYRRLQAFWQDAGVEDEAAWVERRLAFIETGSI